MPAPRPESAQLPLAVYSVVADALVGDHAAPLLSYVVCVFALAALGAALHSKIQYAVVAPHDGPHAVVPAHFLTPLNLQHPAHRLQARPRSKSALKVIAVKFLALPSPPFHHCDIQNWISSPIKLPSHNRTQDKIIGLQRGREDYRKDKLITGNYWARHRTFYSEMYRSLLSVHILTTCAR